MAQKYIVEKNVPHKGSFSNEDDLKRYLDTDPHPTYRLISCEFSVGRFLLVWELLERYWDSHEG